MTCSWLLNYWVENDEFLLFCYSVVVPIDDDIYEVSEPHYYPIVCLKLFLNSVEWKIISSSISQNTRWLELLSQLNEVCGLGLINKILNGSN